MKQIVRGLTVERARMVMDDCRHGETWLMHTALDGCGPLVSVTDICEHGYRTFVAEAELVLSNSGSAPENDLPQSRVS